MLMQKPSSFAEVLNDLNSDIVTTFQILRDPEQAAELARQIRLTPFARAEFELAYQPAETPMEQARRFICRSAMGFGNGATNRQSTGFRNDTTREGSTPAGDFASWPDHVESFTRRLAGVVIEHKPALEVIDIFDGPDTLFYVDPPYPHETRGARNRYQHEMSADDHRELARRLRSIEGAVIISGYPCALYDAELYSDWRRVVRQAYADNAEKRTEVLWLSPSVQDLPLFNGPNPALLRRAPERHRWADQ